MIDPQSLGPAPRETRMKESYAQARRAWAVATVVVGAMLLTWLILENARWQALATRGVTMQGRVVRRWQTAGKGASDNLGVEFPVGGRSHEEGFQVGEYVYDGHDIGATIPVVVDPDDPTNTHLFDFSPETAGRRLLLWGLGWLAGGGFVALLFWADAEAVRKQRKMLGEWGLGELVVDRVLPAEAKQTGLFLSGHVTDAEGRRRTVSRLHLPTGFQAQEAVPVLVGDGADEVVALASIDKADLA